MAWISSLPWLLAAAADAAAPADDSWTVGQKFTIVIGIAIASFVLGYLIARWLRLPDFSARIGFVLATLLVGLAICKLGWPPKLGIDLSGGVVLVYEIDRDQSHGQDLATVLNDVNQRLAALKGQAATARISSSGKIEVVMPSKASQSEVTSQLDSLRTSGITLKPVGTQKEGDKIVLSYDVEQQPKDVNMSKLIDAVNRRINPGGVLELTVRRYGVDQIEVIIPEVDDRQIDDIKKKISTSGLLEFRIVANQATDQRLIAAALRSPAPDVYEGGRVAGHWVKIGQAEVVRPGM